MNPQFAPKLVRSIGLVATAVSLAAAIAALPAAPAVAEGAVPAEATGLGQLTGILPASHLTLPSAIEVNLSQEYVRLPIYPGTAHAGTSHAEKVWYILEDASTPGAADNLGVNYRAQAGQHGRFLPGVRADSPPGQPATVTGPFRPRPPRLCPEHAQLQPDKRIAVPGPDGFPLAKFQPGAVAGPGYTPFIRIAGSDTIYNAPIVATGNGPYDVVDHTNTADRAMGIHIGSSPADSPSGSFQESWVDMLFVKGFDSGQPIVYLSTDAGQPLTAVLERSTYVPALNNVSCNGCDDSRLGPGAAVRFRQRRDRRQQPAGPGFPAPRQGQPHFGERRADQHRVHQRPALRR